MQNRFEKSLIEQCAPTLAGIKPGSLFHYTTQDGENLFYIIWAWNKRLQKKGIKFYLLKESAGGGHVYVYRPALLTKLLADREVRAFLSANGYYDCLEPGTCLARLRSRFGDKGGFPHEIGVFLGYPLHDVKGFIENKGSNFSLCGMWKVYDNLPMAQKLFDQYKRCRNSYSTLYEKGRSIYKLAV